VTNNSKKLKLHYIYTTLKEGKKHKNTKEKNIKGKYKSPNDKE
jgi:hypothetical protein